MSISADGVFDWYRPTLPHEAAADVMLAYQTGDNPMSEPTNAEIAEQEDMRLDAQIDEWYAQFLVPVNRPDLSEAPDPEAPAILMYRVVPGTTITVESPAPPILVEVEECNP